MTSGFQHGPRREREHQLCVPAIYNRAPLHLDFLLWFCYFVVATRSIPKIPFAHCHNIVISSLVTGLY
jgi:hypothetical protein